MTACLLSGRKQNQAKWYIALLYLLTCLSFLPHFYSATLVVYSPTRSSGIPGRFCKFSITSHFLVDGRFNENWLQTTTRGKPLERRGTTYRSRTRGREGKRQTTEHHNNILVQFEDLIELPKPENTYAVASAFASTLYTPTYPNARAHAHPRTTSLSEDPTLSSLPGTQMRELIISANATMAATTPTPQRTLLRSLLKAFGARYFVLGVVKFITKYVFRHFEYCNVIEERVRARARAREGRSDRRKGRWEKEEYMSNSAERLFWSTFVQMQCAWFCRPDAVESTCHIH